MRHFIGRREIRVALSPDTAPSVENNLSVGAGVYLVYIYPPVRPAVLSLYPLGGAVDTRPPQCTNVRPGVFAAEIAHRWAQRASVLLRSQERRDGAVLKLFNGFSIFEHATGRPARRQPHAPEDAGRTLFQ